MIGEGPVVICFEGKLSVIVTVPCEPGLPEGVALILAGRPHGEGVVDIWDVVIERRRIFVKLPIGVCLALVLEVAHGKQVISSVASAYTRGASRHPHAAPFNVGPVAHNVSVARDPTGMLIVPSLSKTGLILV